MVLTRSFYEREEVVAAFLLALIKRREEEAEFWWKELELSAEEDTVRFTLLLAWAMIRGDADWDFFTTWVADSKSLDTRGTLIHSLMRGVPKNMTLWNAYLAQHLQKETDLVEFCTARQQGRGTRLVDLPMVWNLHEEEQERIGRLRSSRTRSIPWDCHFGMTGRGLDQDTRTLLYQAHHHYSLLASPYWAGVLEDYLNEDLEWISDDQKEAFYERVFGEEDIPEEWSLTDQQKSHGAPPSPRKVYSVRRWWMNWFGEEPTLPWVCTASLDQPILAVLKLEPWAYSPVQK